MARTFAATLAASVLVVTGAEARRPLRAEAWAAGLEVPRAHAEARGVHCLVAAPVGRLRIPGGRFIMGSSANDMLRAVTMCRHEVLRSRCDDISPLFRAEGVPHEVRLSPFSIDRTEVTVSDYMRCVETGVCTSPGFGPGDPRFDRPTFPVTHVTWDDATTYCAWAHGRLPTEAEWEYAARGSAGRDYPWGNLYNTHLCNHGAFAAHDATDASDGFVGLAPVGSFPDGATPVGLLDMAGNAGEWVADLYTVDANGLGYAPEPELNPRADTATLVRKGLTISSFHVVRGGSYLDGAAWQRTAARGYIIGTSAPNVGFRCAADGETR